MRDYQKLKIEFSQKLNTFDRDDLLKWLEFDRNRVAVSNLIAGETVKVENSTLSQLRQFDEKEKVGCEVGESDYAMAA